MNRHSKSWVQSLPILASLLIIQGCQFYHAKDSDDDLNLVSREKVSFRMVMNDVITARCLRCHANDFNSYEAVRSRASEIQARALDQKDMPPGAPLSRYEASVLRAWIAAGMPLNEGDTSTPVATPSPSPTLVLQPTFQSIRDGIFALRCAKCHAEGGSHDDIAIFDLQTLTGADGWVVPYSPEKSELYQDLLKKDKGRMPPTKAGPPLLPEQIETIRTWIVNGAKD